MRSTSVHRLTLCALMCALCAVLSQIQIPLPPVPLSLSLLAVYLGGLLLGARGGAAAAGVYVALGAAGIPVFAGFSGGFSALLGPTGGFLLGYIPCAYITGALSVRLGGTRSAALLSMLAGTAVCYALGTAHFMLVSGAALSAALAACVLPFIPGDLLKMALAAHLAPRLRAAMRGAS
ncbi:MAG: biotin transporter BioY [Clostridia bacterium]|nr:biotin transporter BioY [Clostridia bacterium]